jgi:hypothetical protein
VAAGAPAPKRTRSDIESLLRADLSAATLRKKQAAAAFDQALRDLSHLSPSDGRVLLTRAGDAQQKALVAYHAALKRLADLIAQGIVPDDLKEDPRQPTRLQRGKGDRRIFSTSPGRLRKAKGRHDATSH